MWIKSYFQSRKQIVFVNGVLSDELPLNVGVPLGGFKGGLLVHNYLLVYINDIADRLAGKHVYMQMILLSVTFRPI